jgi:hypothetical protein
MYLIETRARLIFKMILGVAKFTVRSILGSVRADWSVGISVRQVARPITLRVEISVTNNDGHVVHEREAYRVFRKMLPVNPARNTQGVVTITCIMGLQITQPGLSMATGVHATLHIVNIFETNIHILQPKENAPNYKKKKCN